MVKRGGKNKKGWGRAHIELDQRTAEDGGDRHIVTSGDEAMKCRHAAVAVR